MIALLTAIIGIVAKGAAAKAIAGGLGGAIVAGSGPLIGMFSQGFVQGFGPALTQLGLALGQTLAGFLVGYVITWLSPKNAEPKA